jgi:hypothetical protein
MMPTDFAEMVVSLGGLLLARGLLQEVLYSSLMLPIAWGLAVWLGRRSVYLTYGLWALILVRLVQVLRLCNGSQAWPSPLPGFGDHGQAVRHRLQHILKEDSMPKAHIPFTCLVIMLIGLFLLPMAPHALDAGRPSAPSVRESNILLNQMQGWFARVFDPSYHQPSKLPPDLQARASNPHLTPPQRQWQTFQSSLDRQLAVIRELNGYYRSKEADDVFKKVHGQVDTEKFRHYPVSWSTVDRFHYLVRRYQTHPDRFPDLDEKRFQALQAAFYANQAIFLTLPFE